jgi:hypothetical protein
MIYKKIPCHLFGAGTTSENLHGCGLEFLGCISQWATRWNILIAFSVVVINKIYRYDGHFSNSA